MSLLGSMPEEPKLSLSLDGSLLDGLELKNPQVGQCLMLCVEACIVGINVYDYGEGKDPCVRFEIESVKQMPGEDKTVQGIAKKFYAGMED